MIKLCLLVSLNRMLFFRVLLWKLAFNNHKTGSIYFFHFLNSQSSHLHSFYFLFKLNGVRIIGWETIRSISHSKLILDQLNRLKFVASSSFSFIFVFMFSSLCHASGVKDGVNFERILIRR